MNKFLISLLFILVSCESDSDSLIFAKFKQFIVKYKKNYLSIDEYLERFEIFKKNYLNLQQEGRNAINEQRTYIMGVTKFSDLTEEEFAKTYLNPNYQMRGYSTDNLFEFEAIGGAPSEHDWRKKNAVTKVKNQGNCGGCWSFACTGNLEGQYAIKKKNLKSFSEQMLIDCDTDDSGCNGGLEYTGWNWIKNNGGLMLEKDYPYKAKKGTCNKNKSKYVSDLKVTGWKRCDKNEETIKEFLYTNGPLAAGINASPLQSYAKGVISADSSRCKITSLNHSVLIVGYGYDSTYKTNYWLVKNSWGSDWGESGYFRVKRGSQTCGINQDVTTSIIQ